MRHYSVAKPFPDSQLNAIVAAVQNRAGGATLLDIACALNPPPPLRNVQRWLNTLVQQNRLVRIGVKKGARYELPVESNEISLFDASPEGKAIQRLVNQPLELRMAADYHRVPLESYSPNRTWYLPADVRARLAAPVAGGNGTAAAQPWRDSAMLQKILVDLAWRSGWLEAQLLDQTPAPLSMSDIAACLAQPEAANVRQEAQLAWNQRAALNLLLSRAPDVAVTQEWLASLYGVLSKAMQGPRRDPGRVTWEATSGASFFRKESLMVYRTSYFLPIGPWIIETCFNEILGWSAAITDPIERAFFVFVHLLYLQPFAMLNASMACLAVNIPLLGAGLPPLTFAGVRGVDLLDGLRGVWELNRTELLRDVFIAAYDDCRARYAR